MKKLLVLVLISALVFGCKKDIQEDPIVPESEIAFSVELLHPGSGLKTDFPPECSPNEPEYAHVIIDGVDYYPEIYKIDGKYYTQNIKFSWLDMSAPSKDFVVTQFVVYDNDDNIIWAAPAANSEWVDYITPGKNLDLTITVNKFEKEQIIIEVLCFQPDVYTYFGFDWFWIQEVIVREECFFGDLCIKHLADYDGSDYENQEPYGVQLDMPAIVEIGVYYDAALINHLPFSPFTNDNEDANWGVGAPVCIQFPDHLHVQGEFYYVEIKILVADGSATGGFSFKSFWTGTITELGELYDADGNFVDPGDDGIVEFVLGECNFSSTDIQMVPYQNLPATCAMQTSSTYAPGPSGTYFDVTLSNLQTGPGPWDIAAGTYGVYCGDQDLDIYVPKLYPNTLVFGSLVPSILPATLPAEFIAGLDEANWLMNNLDNYPTAQWNDIQWALWLLMDDSPTNDPFVPGPSTIANDMATDANTYGSGFLPLPGGWAAVIFHAENPDIPGTFNVQVIFTFVDP